MSTYDMNLAEVLHLPSWFPGMSFKKQMATARIFSKQYLDWPFEYAVQRVVIVLSITHPVRTFNYYVC